MRRWNQPRFLLPALLAVLVVGGLLLRDPSAARAEDPAAKALAAARKRGEHLWKQSWRPGAKACFSCHGQGQNRMTAFRLKSYPKYDKALRRVITGQEKLNYMIVTKCGGKAMQLGAADLTSIEAYISTLR
jgi:cytochrome c553